MIVFNTEKKGPIIIHFIPLWLSYGKLNFVGHDLLFVSLGKNTMACKNGHDLVQVSREVRRYILFTFMQVWL